MNILIVGGAGYVGGALTDILVKTKHSLRVYDCLLYEESYRKNIEFIFGDVRDRKKLLKHLQWADAVVWLAAIVGDGACATNPEIAKEINEKSVRWLSTHFDKKIIFTSTCSVYGAQSFMLDENSPVGPLSVYGTSKLNAEKYLLKKNALIFRLGTLYGIGDAFSRVRLDLVVNTLTVRAFYDKKLKVFGGEQYRPLLHVKDAAKAIAENIINKHTGIFNLHQQNITIADLSLKIQKHFPGIEIEKTEMLFEDLRNYRVSNKKAKEVLKFKPSYTIADGIKEVEYLLTSERIKDINNPRYTNQIFLSMFATHSQFPTNQHEKKD